MIFFLVGLPELETADLECFLEKKGLSPLGVKIQNFHEFHDIYGGLQMLKNKIVDLIIQKTK
jgi:hypothetical protein